KNIAGLVAGDHQDFTIHVKIASSVLDGDKTDGASVASDGTTDPDTSASSNQSSATVHVITQADIEVHWTVARTNDAASPTTPGTLTTFTVTATVTNNGYSDAQNVKASHTSPPATRGTPATAPFDLSTAKYCVVPLLSSTCTPATAYTNSTNVTIGT